MTRIKNKKGYTLIELLLALGIAMILAVGIFFLFQKLDNNQKAITISKELSSLLSQAQTLSTTSHGRTLINNLSPFDPFPYELFDTAFVYDDYERALIMPNKDVLSIRTNSIGGGLKAIVFDMQIDRNKDAAFCTTIANSTVNYDDIYSIRINGATVYEEDQSEIDPAEIKKIITNECYDASKSHSGQQNYIQFWVK